MAITRTSTKVKIYILSNVSVNERGCWIWMRSKRTDGYGVIGWDGKRYSAHRLAYELFIGPIPEGHHLHHYYCAERACCNPNHVTPLLPEEHYRTPDHTICILASKTHCLRGHLYTRETTYVNKAGFRSCKACWKGNYLKYKPKRYGGRVPRPYSRRFA
jgi:HNH endonuclease